MSEIPEISRKEYQEIAEWAENLRANEGRTFWLHKIRGGGLAVTLAPKANEALQELGEAMDARVLEMWKDY